MIKILGPPLPMTTPKSGWRAYLKTVEERLQYQNKEKWMKDMKGSIGLMASIIATMTFQLATNPPGGVVQISLNDTSRCSNSTGKTMCAGQAVLAVTNKTAYLRFLICNIISFVASLGIILLLVSGFPLDYPFAIWLLSIGMCLSVTTIALTYMFAASMVTPDSIWPSDDVFDNAFNVVLVVWASIAAVVGIFHILRLVVRVMIKWFV